MHAYIGANCWCGQSAWLVFVSDQSTASATNNHSKHKQTGCSRIIREYFLDSKAIPKRAFLSLHTLTSFKLLRLLHFHVSTYPISIGAQFRLFLFYDASEILPMKLVKMCFKSSRKEIHHNWVTILAMFEEKQITSSIEHHTTE